MNVFDFVNAIQETKKRDLDIEEYNAFIVNLALSMHSDCIMQANEMNAHHFIPPQAQFDYLINTIKIRRRWAKWSKKTKSEHLEVVKQYYGYNNEKAKAALALLTEDDLKALTIRLARGGLEK